MEQEQQAQHVVDDDVPVPARKPIKVWFLGFRYIGFISLFVCPFY
jgi:hypothetical protein